MNIVHEALLFPAYATYGAWVFLGGVLRASREVLALRRLFEAELRCPTCGFQNAVHDRWACGDCGAEYMGSVYACSICGAGASWFPCSRCRAAVRVRSR